MTCYFCKSDLGNQDKNYLMCRICSTEEIQVGATISYTHIFYRKYQVLLDIDKNITHICDLGACSVLKLNGLPISPYNIKDKLSTYILLS